MASLTGVFASAASAEADWALALEACVDRLGQPDGNLGFLYLTDQHARHAEAIRDRLASATGVENWVGTTSPGIAAGGLELFGRPGIATMVAKVPEASFQLFDGEPGAGADWLGIVHADPADQGLVDGLTALEDATGAFLIGGLTASPERGMRFAGGPATKGLSGVLFDDRVPVVTGLTQGCNIFGPVHEVTAFERNLALTLDGRPALAVLEDDLRAAHKGDPQIIERPLAAALPLTDTDRADYLVRDFTGIDRKRGVIGLNVMLHQGMRLQFCARDAHSALLDLERMLADVKRRLEGRPPKGAVYVSCVARGPNLFGSDSRELGLVQRALGDAPVVGFFAGGEISAARLYTYTGVLAVFC